MNILLKKLYSWYFRGYDNRSRELVVGVVSRFSRGNVLIQEGKYLDQDGLKALSVRGDEAIRRLEQAN